MKCTSNSSMNKMDILTKINWSRDFNSSFHVSLRASHCATKPSSRKQIVIIYETCELCHQMNNVCKYPKGKHACSEWCPFSPSLHNFSVLKLFFTYLQSFLTNYFLSHIASIFYGVSQLSFLFIIAFS